MPFKSKAQRRKFAELLVQGEISPETYEEWNRETGRKELPERVTPAKKANPARKTKAKSKAKAKAKAKSMAKSKSKSKRVAAKSRTRPT